MAKQRFGKRDQILMSVQLKSDDEEKLKVGQLPRLDGEIEVGSQR